MARKKQLGLYITKDTQKKRLEKIFTAFGFEITQVIPNDYKNTYNIEVIGKKIKNLSITDAKNAAKEYLADYMVDDSDTEKRMLDVWFKNFETQLNKTFAN